MARYYPGSKVPFQTSFTNNGVLTNVATISFKYKMGRFGTETSVTPDNPTTGVYTTSVTPLEGGYLYGRWDTDGEYDTVVEPIISIAESAFTVTA